MILMGLMRTFQIKLLFAFLSKGTVTFLVVVAMIVNNSYITTSVKKCNQLKVVPIMQQSLEMEQLLFGLSFLKVGLGPTALCWYAFSVIGLVSIAYLLSVTISLFAIPAFFGYIIMICNISACAKEAYEALQSAGQVKRFTLTMIYN